MLLEIHDVQVSDTLHELARQEVERALRPFQESVERVDVRIQDVNGPRGGVNKRCSVTAKLAATMRKVVVKSTSPDAHEAVRAACGRLGESVSRALTRRLDGSSAPPPPAARPGSEEESRIKVTAADHQRLQSVINTWSDTRDRAATEALADELDRAEVVPVERIAGNVVTMNSRVVFQDEQTGETREVSLVYPQDSDPEHGRISVLAPVGSALLGLSVGQTIDWPIPRGHLKRLRIVKVVYQPEEAGHLYL